MVASLQTDSRAGSRTSPALMMDTPHNWRGREGGREVEVPMAHTHVRVHIYLASESLPRIFIPLWSGHSYILSVT